MDPPVALQSTEAQRLRQVAFERRIFPILLLIAAVMWVGLALLALSYPLRDILATAAVGLGYMAFMLFAQRRAVRSAAPLLWLTLQELGVIGVLVFTMTWSGGILSPALPITIIIAMVIGMRYPFRWGAAQVVVSIAAIVAGMWIVDPEAVRASPVFALSWVFAFVLASLVTNMLARAERGARRDALHDALTGVLNRMALYGRLEDAQAHPARRAATLSVIAADLDGLKAVNDRDGHGAGDAVLCAVAASLSASIREGDLLYRLGGDEFLIVLPATPTSEATDLAERLRTTISSLGPAGRGVTLSSGVAGVVHAQVDLEHLIRRADRALYAAKASGRDRVCIAEPDLPAVPVAH